MRVLRVLCDCVHCSARRIGTAVIKPRAPAVPMAKLKVKASESSSLRRCDVCARQAIGDETLCVLCARDILSFRAMRGSARGRMTPLSVSPTEADARNILHMQAHNETTPPLCTTSGSHCEVCTRQIPGDDILCRLCARDACDASTLLRSVPKSSKSPFGATEALVQDELPPEEHPLRCPCQYCSVRRSPEHLVPKFPRL